MNQRRRALAASAGIVGIFLLVQLGALALVEPFEASGLQPDVDHQDPRNSLLYIGAILVATVLMLLALRRDAMTLIRAFIVFSGAYVAVFVFRVVLPPLLVVGGFHALAWVAGALLGVALWIYPEWYVIDAAGVVMGIAAAALFGITFGVLPAVILLVVLAVYDAISVYGTEHMLTLASGVMEMRVPIVLVMPLTLSYSFLDADLPDPTDDGQVDGEGDGEAESELEERVSEEEAELEERVSERESEGESEDEEAELEERDGEAKRHGDREAATAPEAPAAADGVGTDAEQETGTGEEPEDGDGFERDALFIGLGDAVIPTVLVASVAFFAPGGAPSLGVPYVAMTLPTLTAMVGMLAGLVALLWMVLRGRAHAGLPLLNGGTLLGYLSGAVLTGVSLVEALGLSGFL